MIGVLRPLKGSDTPIEDQDTFLKAQLIFWLIGATDGHAENFSVFLSPGGSYRMTPFYDIVSAQGALNARQLERKQMKMAMSVGDRRHYRVDQIHGRHFVQTATRAGISKKRAKDMIEEIAAVPGALGIAAESLPASFPQSIVEAISTAMTERLAGLRVTGTELSIPA
ncbi:MAG: HipA domain-containing protein [Pseudomonadota bacterium]|nr:HipA domain-containing protein [Pseudomonadota bacterium]